MKLTVCPSMLTPGFDTYSPKARKLLFDGRTVSHQLDFCSPDKANTDIPEVTATIGRVSVSGVQPKLAMLVDAESKLRYTADGERGTFIAKPQPTAWHILNRQDCPANENLTMQIASQVYGLPTAANGLAVYADDAPVYITRRFDIDYKNNSKYLLEDFAALLGVTRVHGGSEYKYCNGSYEECGEIIRHYVNSWMVDCQRLFRLVLFNFLTLNDDAHLKNFSLIKIGGEYHLAPAYDLINTSLHLRKPRIFALDRGLFKEGMSMSDVKSIRRKDFNEFGLRLGLPSSVVSKILDQMSTPQGKAKDLVDASLLSDESKNVYWLSYEYRRKMLTF